MMQRIKFFKQYAQFMPSESAWLPENVVSELVTSKKAKRYVADEETLEEWDSPQQASDAGEPADEDNKTLNKEELDPAKDPFILDGLDVPTSTALHVAGLHTPGDVEKYLNDGKLLTDLANIAEGRAKKILDLYGVK